MNVRATIAACLIAAQFAFVPARAATRDAKSGADDVVVDERTEKTIDSALRYLASRQLPNGSWVEGDRNHAAAITAYVLMAFMSSGNLPNEGPYGESVRRGVSFLLECIRADGYIAAADGASNMYGHGIATIALGEIYGMTHDDTIKPRLERAVALILKAQSPQGGWRYNPRPADADISVTVLQVVALRVAKNCGLDVPQDVIDKAVAYIHKCSHSATGGFTYLAAQGEPNSARTAAAIYSLQVCGLYTDPMIGPGSKFLFDRFGKDRENFTYGSYYAAPAHYMIGGDTWRRWYAMMRDLLLKEQRTQDGGRVSWNPQGQGGEVYATAVNVTILSMPYGYVPLYQR